MILDNARFTIIRDRWAKGEKELFCAGNLGGWTPDLQWSSITCWLFKGVLYRCSTSLALSMFTSQGAATNEFVSQGSKIETLSHCPEQHKVAPLLCRSYTTIKERAEHSIRVGHLQSNSSTRLPNHQDSFLLIFFSFYFFFFIEKLCNPAVVRQSNFFVILVGWLQILWKALDAKFPG